MKYFLNNAIYSNNKENIFFKDVFTKTEEGIDIDANNLNFNSFTSNSNNFNLDSDGNLFVNTITARSGLNVDGAANPLNIYPVGSIYMNTTDLNPEIIFGGTWERFSKGRVLIGLDETQEEFNTEEKTGGEKTHTLTIAEMPSHNHTGTTNSAGDHTHNAQGFWRGSGNTAQDRVMSYVKNTGDSANSSFGTTAILNSGSHTHTYTTSSIGSNQSHNNIQPYITCYMWKRTA